MHHSVRTFLLTLSLIALDATAKSKEIVLAWENAPRSFDPRYSVDANSQYLEDLIHCSLVNFDDNGSVVPSLATKFVWKTPSLIALEIRKDIKFSNGKSLTPEDIIATYESIISSSTKPASPRAGAFREIESITNHPKHGLLFQLKSPDATFITNLTIGVLPKEFLAKGVVSLSGEAPSCGSFQVKSTAANSIKLTANPHAPKDWSPKSKNLLIKIVKDESTRYAKLVTGEVDLVQNSLNFSKLSEIARKHPHLKIQKRPGLKTSYIGINMKDPVLAKEKVRRALAHAINRDEIIKYILGGLATKAKTLLPPSDPLYFSKVEHPEFNRAKADALLTEAGFPPGTKGKPRLTISYKTTQNTTRIAIAKALGSQLKKINVQLKVEALEWGRFKEDVEKGRVQLWGLTWVGFKDPDIYRYAFASESFPPNGGNRGRYSNPALDKLLIEAKITTNTEKRKDLYTKVQTQVAQDLPYIFLWHEENYAVHPISLNGFKLFADGRYSALSKAWKQ